MKIYCASCGRQVVPRNESTQYIAPGLCPKAAVGLKQVFCDECSQELDENGLFPEERALLPEEIEDSFKC